jgi:hypothetical protein
MNSEQAKQILIENYLLSIGITPVKQSGVISGIRERRASVRTPVLPAPAEYCQ